MLHRPGELAGVNDWNSVLERGASRTEVLVSFCESAENQAAVANIIGNGV